MFNRILANMKNPLLLLFFLCSSVAFAQQQKIALSKINSEALKADAFVGYDSFGWKYFIVNNTFNKQKDSLILQYKNLALGKLRKVDLQNPLQIVLFYESFNTVIILDNQLNETQKIPFSENTVPIVAAAAGMASQNRLWIYNSLSQQIGLFDYLKNDYMPITVPFAGRLRYYESDFNYFYWIDDKLNRFACDVYGKVSEYGTVSDFDHFQIVNENWFFYSKADKLYAHDVKNDKNFALQIDEKTFKSFHCEAQILSIFTKEGITNYKITLP